MFLSSKIRQAGGNPRDANARVKEEEEEYGIPTQETFSLSLSLGKKSPGQKLGCGGGKEGKMMRQMWWWGRESRCSLPEPRPLPPIEGGVAGGNKTCRFSGTGTDQKKAFLSGVKKMKFEWEKMMFRVLEVQRCSVVLGRTNLSSPAPPRPFRAPRSYRKRGKRQKKGGAWLG